MIECSTAQNMISLKIVLSRTKTWGYVKSAHANTLLQAAKVGNRRKNNPSQTKSRIKVALNKYRSKTKIGTRTWKKH